MFDKIYRNKKVFLTGHSGFKGSWLGLWLHSLGAKVYGYSLAPSTTPNHYALLNSNIFANSNFNNINNYTHLESSLLEVEPEIIFHLAAQPLVRYSYQEPLYTFQTNAIGTLGLLNAARKLKKLKAIVIITTDKVYENQEWIYGYRECDRLGGYDPYSASKACAEIITDSMRRSFFSLETYNKTHNVLIATARAGNVIGGGNFSQDRLLPDLIHAATSSTPASIRNPNATRPWQHVLEPLRGYLMLGEKLLKGESKFATSFNFGPDLKDNLSVQEILKISQTKWNKIQYKLHKDVNTPHEANLLMLDSTKAQKMLGWNPIWNHIDAITYTINWYREFYENHQVISMRQLEEYKSLLLGFYQ